MRIPVALLIAVQMLGAPRAHADIYAYTSPDGIAHYSNVPTDPRYVLLMIEPPTARPQPRSAGSASADRLGRAAAYTDMIDVAARQVELQPALLRAVIAVESAFNPQAVSAKGAKGLMQLRPATALFYGVRHPFDPVENLRGGSRYLRDLLNRYGNNVELALAAYNAGEDAVDRHGRAIPPFAETRAYVPAVLGLYRKFLSDSHIASYGGSLPPST